MALRTCSRRKQRATEENQSGESPRLNFHLSLAIACSVLAMRICDAHRTIASRDFITGDCFCRLVFDRRCLDRARLGRLKEEFTMGWKCWIAIGLVLQMLAFVPAAWNALYPEPVNSQGQGVVIDFIESVSKRDRVVV